MADAEFDVQAKHVERQLGELRSSIAAFAKLSTRLNGEDPVVKRSIRTASQEIQTAACSIENDTNSLAHIERHPKTQVQAQRKLRQNRLLRDLNALKKQFKAVTETAKLLEHKEALSLREGERSNELQSLLDCDEVVLVEEGVDIERGLEEERTQELSHINRKVSMVQEAFQSFAEMTSVQGELLDDIEACVASTRTDTSRAMKDLTEVAAARSCGAAYVVLALVAAISLYLIAI